MAEARGSTAVIIECDGRSITGSYKISREIITVTSDLGSKRSHIGSFHRHPEGLARLMLVELALEGNAKAAWAI
jgi:hypothetical protein